MENKQRGCLRLAQEGQQHIRSRKRLFFPFHPQGFSHIVRLHRFACHTNSPKGGQHRCLSVANLQHAWLYAGGRVSEDRSCNPSILRTDGYECCEQKTAIHAAP